MQIGLASMDFHIRVGGQPSVMSRSQPCTQRSLSRWEPSSSSVRAFDGLTTLSSDEDRTRSRAPPSRLDWQTLLSTSTSLLDPQYLSEICMMFDLLSKALRNGERLQHASFSLLENHFKYSVRNRNIDAFLRKKAVGKQQSLTEGGGRGEWSVLLDPMYLRYTTARMAAITLATELDKFKAIVQDLWERTRWWASTCSKRDTTTECIVLRPLLTGRRRRGVVVPAHCFFFAPNKRTQVLEQKHMRVCTNNCCTDNVKTLIKTMLSRRPCFQGVMTSMLIEL